MSFADGHFSICRLYFWIFNPNKPLVEYHHVRLFDLSCNMRHVTIVQWPTNPRYLIVVGTEYTDFSLDSMITIVSVPKIGCSECKILRDLYDDDSKSSPNNCFVLCLLMFACFRTMHSMQPHNPYEIFPV